MYVCLVWMLSSSMYIFFISQFKGVRCEEYCSTSVALPHRSSGIGLHYLLLLRQLMWVSVRTPSDFPPPPHCVVAFYYPAFPRLRFIMLTVWKIEGKVWTYVNIPMIRAVTSQIKSQGYKSRPQELCSQAPMFCPNCPKFNNWPIYGHPYSYLSWLRYLCIRMKGFQNKPWLTLVARYSIVKLC